jgi:hypothetical protein
MPREPQPSFSLYYQQKIYTAARISSLQATAIRIARIQHFPSPLQRLNTNIVDVQNANM